MSDKETVNNGTDLEMHKTEEQSSHEETKWVFPASFFGTAAHAEGNMEQAHWILQTPLWFLRNYGSALFLNNPFCGLLIVIAFFLNSPFNAICSLISLLISLILFYVIDKDDRVDLKNGSLAFNSLLVGNVLPTFFKNSWDFKLILLVIIASVLCTIIQIALRTVMRKLGGHEVNFSYALTIILLILVCQTSRLQSIGLKLNTLPLQNSTNKNSSTDWMKVLQSTYLAVGQTCGVTNHVSSILMTAAFLIFSPLLFMQAILSAFFASVFALLLSLPSAQIYMGVYSFNSVLLGCTLGGLFIMWNPVVQIINVVLIFIAVILQGGLKSFMGQVPCLTLPFFIMVNLGLIALAGKRYFSRVEHITYPEQQLAEQARLEKEHKDENLHNIE